MISSVGILGGGNAGLISALMLRTAFPNLTIQIIKSSKFGTIGVGEGSNEHWLDFSKIVGISNADLIREAGATFKHGIKFINWRGTNDVFYHSLPEFLCSQDTFTGLPFNLMYMVANDVNPEKVVWDLSVKGKIVDPNSIGQFHFNTFKLNSFLEKLCLQRNISVIEDTVIDVLIDNEGFVSSLVGEKDQYKFDFFIDSSGFQRIIFNKLDSKWISYEKYLPTNAAIAFPSKLDDSIPTFTDSVARSAGWSWKAPVQGRYGNGYVYNKDLISLEKAVEEIQPEYLDKINIAKEVKFIAGKSDKFWIKNALAVGLSGSFIEPLEASNIGTTIEQIKCLMSYLVCWDTQDSFTPNKYNKIFDRVSENILDYVQLHYLGPREDTEFWRWCKYDMPLTDFNRETVNHFKNNFVSYNYFHENNYELFDELDWIQLMHGLKLFDVEKVKEIYNKQFKMFESITLREFSFLPNHNNYKIHSETIKEILGQL